MRIRSLSFGFIALFALSGSASAQEGGYSLNRFDPSERGSEWFSQESLDLRGHVRPALGIVGDYAYKPLVLYANGGDDEAVAIVRHQMFLHLGGSLVLWDRARFGVSLPVAVMNNGDSGVLAGQVVSGSEGASIGDLRLGGDVRLLGEYGEAFNLAAGLQLHLPTGDETAFTGDSKVRVVPRIMAAGDVGDFAYAAKLHFNYRAANDNVHGDDYPLGSEIGLGLAAGVRLLDKKLLLGPELYGATTVSDGGDGLFAERTTPLEVIIGGHYTAGDWRLGLGAGPGLTRGAGSPKVRVLASVEWVPGVEEQETAGPSDRDDDGIMDDQDACPDVPGVASDDQSENGCPPPADRDGDGIVDDQDACPDKAGVTDDDPTKNGCPPPSDRDGDGILDAQDACPDEAGVASDDAAKNGCPAPKDSDGDGIIDDVDACPDEKGVSSADPKKNGCPKVRLVGQKIDILERIEFDTAKATIRPESEGVLKAVLQVLKDYPSIKKLSIEGHTDNRGGKAFNTRLSRNRAAAVRKWLIDHGIDAARLTSAGYGPSKPRDSNDTEEGRQNNRRVEFNIVEGSARKEVPAK